LVIRLTCVQLIDLGMKKGGVRTGGEHSSSQGKRGLPYKGKGGGGGETSAFPLRMREKKKKGQNMLRGREGGKNHNSYSDNFWGLQKLRKGKKKKGGTFF